MGGLGDGQQRESGNINRQTFIKDVRQERGKAGGQGGLMGGQRPNLGRPLQLAGEEERQERAG